VLHEQFPGQQARLPKVRVEQQDARKLLIKQQKLLPEQPN
jgi:hypothetical protein